MECSTDAFGATTAGDIIWISNIRVTIVVGCNPEERGRTQPIIATVGLHIDVSECGRTDDLHATVNYSVVAKRVASYCEAAGCYTLEALATGIAREVFLLPECARVERVSVRVDKPQAFRSLPAVPGVQLSRSRNFFRRERELAAADAATLLSPPPILTHTSRTGAPVTAYLAVGSNMGDRVANIEAALTLLSRDAARGAETLGAFLRVADTSWLYETPAAYVLDQPAFLNGALRVETNLTPQELLRHIKRNVEDALGREKSIRFGPRCIDVDILFYGGLCLSIADVCDGDGAPTAAADAMPLVVPHPLLAEREFVLGPLNDICSNLVHPSLHVSVGTLLARLHRVPGSLQRILPLGYRYQRPRGVEEGIYISSSVTVPQESARRSEVEGSSASAGSSATTTPLLRLHGRTHIMGIVNVTPDSFSDGGGAGSTVDGAIANGLALAASGAVIIDVGGQSTRPGASAVSDDAETQRVIPVIKALAAALPPHVAISIDTFYASVARAAVTAGAGMINDVSGGERDPRMLGTAAELRVPIVLMHMRGDPATMQSLAHYGTAEGAAAEGIQPHDASSSSSSSAAASQSGGRASAVSVAPSDALPRASTAAAAGSEPPDGSAVVSDVRSVLMQRADAAVRAGVRRWSIILDPGLGFAKQPAHSFALLRPTASLSDLRFPLLYGPSRKGFLGSVTGMAVPSARVWATAAAVTAAVAVGADIVRVHDVEEMRDVVAVADAIYRGGAGVPALQK